MAEAFSRGDRDAAKRIFVGRDFAKGAVVQWRHDHPERGALERDFGEGPFTVRAIEPGAPEGGLWLSLTNAEGLTWLKGAWARVDDEPGVYKAVPPTFHSDWFDPVV